MQNINILNPVFQNTDLPVLWKQNTNGKFKSPTSVTCLWSTNGQNASKTASCSASANICAELILIADVGNIKKKKKKAAPLWESQTYPVTSQMPHNPVSQSFIPKIPYFASLLSHVRRFRNVEGNFTISEGLDTALIGPLRCCHI